MEIYPYYQPHDDELFGYSHNDILYSASLVANTTPACDHLPVCKPGATDDAANQKACVDRATCENQHRLAQAMQSRSSNGRYIDSKNIYLTQVIHLTNMAISCIVLGVAIYAVNR
jgi:hypothetical protein